MSRFPQPIADAMWFAPPQSEVHVERRESEPRMSAAQADELSDLQRDYDNRMAYEHCLNEACQAIKAMPFELVDSAFIGKLLSEIADKARINEPEIADELDVIAFEVTP